MTVEVHEKAEGRILEVPVTGKLTREDYEHFTPKIEQRIEQHGKVRLLLHMQDFEGWDAGALWEDIKFDVKHFNDVERLAMVGENKWQKGMSAFSKPFTTATVRYFDKSELEEARQWISEP